MRFFIQLTYGSTDLPQKTKLSLSLGQMASSDTSLAVCILGVLLCFHLPDCSSMSWMVCKVTIP